MGKDFNFIRVKIVLLYYVSNKSSYEKMYSLIKDLKNDDYKEKTIFIVGNQIEKNNRIISKVEGKNIEECYNVKYFEISCKTGEVLEKLKNK